MGNGVSSTFRYCLATVLALAVVFALFGMTRSHALASPAGVEAVDLAATDVKAADHGHLHDDDGALQASHSHGHNPADHTHETPTGIPVFSMQFGVPGQSWAFQRSTALIADNSVRLERPPRV